MKRQLLKLLKQILAINQSIQMIKVNAIEDAVSNQNQQIQMATNFKYTKDSLTAQSTQLFRLNFLTPCIPREVGCKVFVRFV